MQLVVGLAAEQRAVIAGRDHVAQTLRPVAAGQQQEEAEELGHGRRDVRVVLVEPDAEARVLELRIERERVLERLLDPLAVARRGEPLDAQHAPLHARAVGAAEVEPGLGAAGLAHRPRLGRRDGRVDLARELARRARCCRDRAGSATRARSRRGAGTRRAAPGGTRAPSRRPASSKRASRIEVVDRGEAPGLGERRGAKRESGGQDRRRRPAATRPVPCLTPRSSSAAASRRGVRAPAERGGRAGPGTRGRVASHSFEYMLIVVKPGIVLTSLTKMRAALALHEEVDARHARAVHRPEGLDGHRPDLGVAAPRRAAPG